MKRTAHLARATIAVAATAALCAACSPAPRGATGSRGAPEASASVDPVTRLVDTVVSQSHDEKRYDSIQRRILADRAVDYAEYEEAIGKALDCMRETGAGVIVEGPQMREGKTQIIYAIEVPTGDDALLAEADACYERYAGLVDMFWQTTGPEIQEFEDRRAEALTPALRECLTKYGVDWAEDESFDDLLDKAFLLLETEKSDCILEIGYMTWQG